MHEAPSMPWQDTWFDAAALLSMSAWRGVESQHYISTLRLVDTREEHDALEAMLNDSKPPLPEGGNRLHYLLSTPFRYVSPEPSRFRRAGDAGVWYGADSTEAACAEIAYWRYRFIVQSAGLAKDDTELVTTHTLYKADVNGMAIDLTSDPWSENAAIWTHHCDYSGSQLLAAEARERGIEWIRYSSVRHPGAICAAALMVSALAGTVLRDAHEWLCRATRHRVLFLNRENGTTHSWDF